MIQKKRRPKERKRVDQDQGLSQDQDQRKVVTEIGPEIEIGESPGAEAETGESLDPSPEKDIRNTRETGAERDTVEIGVDLETDIIEEMTDTETETMLMICAGTRKTQLAIRNTAEDLAVVNVNYNVLFRFNLCCIFFNT